MRPPENRDIRKDVAERPVLVTITPYQGERVIVTSCWHHGAIGNIFDRTEYGHQLALRVARQHVGVEHMDLLQAGYTGIYDQVEGGDLA